jgi:nicotinamidase/pyrazinamidase
MKNQLTYWIAPQNTLLLHVDLTNDFMPGGKLAVAGGDDVVPIANSLRPHFQHIGWTKEEHPVGHAFFASSHPDKQPLDTVETPFGTQFLWPDHCITGTAGADFHPALIVDVNDLIVVKGTDPNIHAYSAVYMDDRKTIIHYPDGKTLPEKLREQGIEDVVVDGLAYDFCAGMVAYDLAKEGFKVYLLRDATRSIVIPLSEGKTTETVMDAMLAEAGVIVTDSQTIGTLLQNPPPPQPLAASTAPGPTL